jgi:GMP reductase
MLATNTKELDFDDVFILPQLSELSSRSQVNLEREFIFTNGFLDIDSDDDDNKLANNNSNIIWKGVPIISANMDTTGTFKVYNILKKYKMLTALNKFYTIEDFKNAERDGIELDPEYYMVSTGITEENFENLKQVVEYTKCKWICIDVANGYMKSFVDFCKKVRQLYPNKIIVAGNVVTPEMVKTLIMNAGIDVIKVGIGSGSACLTRRQTGIGRPQLSAIIDCVNMCSQLQNLGYNSYIISDGGIKFPCDMAKAFAGGAHFVMIGGVFAGHDENPGDVIEENGRLVKMFYGMSSKHAMEKYFGKMDDYRSSEGAVIKVPYKGPLEHTVKDFLGGLRSTCTYVGASNIIELNTRARFVPI